MNFTIHLKDADYTVHTEVGDGLARVVVAESEPVEVDLEESE